MDRPLEIAFHQMEPSADLEALIRAQAARLEQRFRHLTGCRVSVEALHQQHRTGNPVEVHIVLSVPGRDLAVSRAPGHAREKHPSGDVHAIVREAFRAAESQLESFKGHIGEDVAAPSGSATAGVIEQAPPGADHGYLVTPVGRSIYFHRDSVTNGRFEDLRVGDRVHFVEEEGDAGPVATKVRVAAAG